MCTRAEPLICAGLMCHSAVIHPSIYLPRSLQAGQHEAIQAEASSITRLLILKSMTLVAVVVVSSRQLPSCSYFRAASGCDVVVYD